ncbi:MAG: bifunctional pyr operon transcriptional regulator/uracil phosphoribosyltransferase PyrR [Verrucomicrobiota bacterium]
MTESDLTKHLVLGERDIATKIRRLAIEILEKAGDRDFRFVGIHKRGVTVAERAVAVLKDERPEIPLGSLDISLYRDDLDNLGTNPSLESSDIPFEVDGAHVILFDDVLFTGRTIRAAIDGLMDYGRPSKIELAVLIDRGNRELPIHADYCGHVLDTTRDEYIRVRFEETDGEEGIWLLK